MSSNLETFINDTDMMNEEMQSQTGANNNAGGTVQGNESNPTVDATNELKDGQVTDNASGKTSLKEVTGKERDELTKEEEKDVKESIAEIRDIVTMTCGILTQPDGKLVDFSDKEGRRHLKDALLAFKTQMQNSINDSNLENKSMPRPSKRRSPRRLTPNLSKRTESASTG